MALYLKDTDIGMLLTTRELIDPLREVFVQMHKGKAFTAPRTTIEGREGALSLMGAVSEEWGLAAVKTFYSRGGNMSFMLTLFSTATPEPQPLAVMEAQKLGQLRTGAASGLATDLLAPRNARVFGCIGAGYQARAQVEGVLSVRHIERVIVHSRNKERMENFADWIRKEHGVEVSIAADVNPSFKEADIVTCITTSSSPVIDSSSLGETCHINAVGGYRADMLEVGPATVASCSAIVSDLKEQAMKESGELISAVDSGLVKWDEIAELSEIAAGTAIRRRNAATSRTMFKSLGVGIEDLAAARAAYQKALERGAGTLP